MYIPKIYVDLSTDCLYTRVRSYYRYCIKRRALGPKYFSNAATCFIMAARGEQCPDVAGRTECGCLLKDEAPSNE